MLEGSVWGVSRYQESGRTDVESYQPSFQFSELVAKWKEQQQQQQQQQQKQQQGQGRRRLRTPKPFKQATIDCKAGNSQAVWRSLLRREALSLASSAARETWRPLPGIGSWTTQ
ncbi:uncharacterized protein BO80DRAFT_420826 [Aspergillus ibericus CBS 121593]|uniref:Uncharacterized protein n=1 Tax=Aspergillus ibericus CBS 121593 TaxID=1448316 RepID=A0A395HCT1_9EURO|nr:hypothetical protein BO80DRAFT_420826 [Aspergillus ibericus CBS 121593]RAL05622.1 hypothetical protein BO80DRAFT_420826 [Aspergillus ibericus CBS 121593]